MEKLLLRKRAWLASLAALTGMLFILAAAPGPLNSIEPELPRIVILASYNEGDAWTDNQIAGVLSGLQTMFPALEPATEYLDAKRYPNPEDEQRSRVFLASKYHNRRINLVIALDNPALNLLLKYRREIFPNASVIFGGINDFHPDMIADQPRITGVSQNLDFLGTLEMARRLHPEAKRVLVVHDYSISGQAVHREVEAVKPQIAGQIEIFHPDDGTFADLTHDLQSLPPDSLVILMIYVTDRGGQVFSRARITEMISMVSPAPVYATHKVSLGHGIVGGMLLDGEEHGRQVAGLALKVLTGTPADELPVEKSRSLPYLDYKQLVRFHVPEERWPEDAILVNRPVSYWERNRAVLVPAFSATFVLAALVVWLSIALARMNLAREAEKASKHRFQLLFETMAQGVVFQDAEGAITAANPAAEQILGLSLDQMQGRTSLDPRWRAVHADGSDFPGSEHPGMQALQTGKPVNSVIMGVFNPQEEAYRWLLVSATPDYMEGETRPYQVYATFTDITARKQSEETLERALQEKEALLRELYHRTKNNMQVISAMLALHASQTADDRVKTVFQEMENRIRAMALVHQQLYQTQKLSHIRLDRYIEDLAAPLLESYGLSKQSVKLHLELEPVEALIDTAIPFGLILNELISNSLKHAFPAGREGQIWIELCRDGEAIVLTVSDDGVGVEPGFDFRKQTSMGLRTIFALAENQLLGEVCFENRPGVVCTIRFKDESYTPRV